MNTSSAIESIFGNKLRVRVCGICFEDDKLLLVKHLNIGKMGVLWAPPGGGLNFDERAEDCLLREFKEETGLKIKVKDFLFVYEYFHLPLHIVELFFKVEIMKGELIKGIDPELSASNQIIEEVKFCSQEFLNAQHPDTLHGALLIAGSVGKISELKGYYCAQ